MYLLGCAILTPKTKINSNSNDNFARLLIRYLIKFLEVIIVLNLTLSLPPGPLLNNFRPENCKILHER